MPGTCLFIPCSEKGDRQDFTACPLFPEKFPRKAIAMIRVLFYLRLIDLNEGKVPDTFSLNSLKNLPISETRIGVPTQNLAVKGVGIRLENQKREPNA